MTDDPNRVERNRERFAHRCRQVIRAGELAANPRCLLEPHLVPSGLSLKDVQDFRSDFLSVRDQMRKNQR